MTKTNRREQRELTANEFIQVKDIKGNFLYTKDNYLFGYLRIFPYNLDLLPQESRRGKTQNLSLAFGEDRKDFCYCAFPREVDLDDYKTFLKEKSREELTTVGRRKILSIMLLEAAELSTSGENYEHQHFIKLWQKVGRSMGDAEHDLLTRLEEFKTRYAAVGIMAEVLSELDIIKLCNLFGNSQQMSYQIVDENTAYASIPQIRG